MSFTKPRVSLTESLLVSLLLFSLPIRCLCRQQFIRNRFAVRYEPSSLEITMHGEREKRSAVPPKIFSGSSCCYCGAAVYKATFISKWNKTTHPVDFPDKLAHFSAVIGGTHKAEHVIWELGSKASAAVKKFSEWGDTRSLLNKISRREYLGIIRTSQVWKSNRPVSDRFRADRTRHYLSIMSKISPSPDWFVGIDRLDLCNASSCTWKKNVTIQLTPIDAGTDSGLKFITNNMATKPSQPIHRISPNYPNHPDASFFHRQQRSVSPMAQFNVQLLHTKGKCTKGSVHCKVSRWSSWTSCSNSCGRGKKTRGRVILIKPRNNGKACPKITRSKGCRGRNCTGKADCSVKSWSKWSACSKTCGKGRRTRKRQVVVYPREGGKNCPNLIEKEKCRRPKCPIVDCKVSSWSNWDACNKSCGRGKRQRARSVMEHPNKGGARCPRLHEKQACNIFRCRGISRLSSISG